MEQHDAALAEQGLQATWDRLKSADADRRRPGRLDQVNPTLIPLLRGMPTLGLALNETGPVYARGRLPRAASIAIIAILSALLWAVIGFAGWAILG